MIDLTPIERLRMGAALADVFKIGNGPIGLRQNRLATLIEIFTQADLEDVGRALLVSATIANELADDERLRINTLDPNTIAERFNVTREVAILVLKRNGRRGEP